MQFYLKDICPEKIFLEEEHAAYTVYITSTYPDQWVTLPGPANWKSNLCHA